ncbi:MAG: PD40 domain-containing protein [Polyangiaceae bacterium]|nr:PD40 domain-containing protein [Polyangiaceae bacterium]
MSRSSRPPLSGSPRSDTTRGRRLAAGRPAAVAALLGLASVGCNAEPRGPESTFYDRKIGPILLTSCATSPSQSSCHVSADDKGNALGNLNLSSFEALSLRRDLLVDYGPYGIPGLLLKAVPPFEIRLTSWDSTAQTVTTDIAHAGGSLMDFTSVSYTQIERWIANGGTKNNATPKQTDPVLTACSQVLGIDPSFDASADPADADFAQFSQQVAPVLAQSCAAGNCHGNASNSLYLTCGASPEQVRWNYFAASDYVSVDAPASEIVRRVLAPAQGGTYHEGGALFESASDPGYQAILKWAEAKGGPTNVPSSPGFEFFAKRVQPMLVKRGCMMLGCHSASMFHDYRLRGGSGGHFGLPATRRNYQLTVEQIALESPDPNASRLLRKNLPPTAGGGGILHRGGPLLASGGDPSACDATAAATGPLDEQNAYCVIAAWMELERGERMAGADPLSGIVYVERPPKPGKDTPQDYAEYSPGADLMLATASLDASGDVSAGSASSLLGGCGLSPASVDVRRPAVSWDGKKIAFAARTGASEPFRVYVIDGANCAVEPTIDAAPVDDTGAAIPSNGELIHNFDPAFAPDGRLVFASTRGNVTNAAAFQYKGPQRTPADPSKLNSNLYVAEGGKIRQLTYLLNQEFLPGFMNDGRLIFVTEKRAPGFYQLAGRRQNLDGGDYHPLFGQRSTIGHNQFTDVVELTDKNLAAILSERGAAHGAGTLAIINRSIGVDQLSDDPADYIQDPDAIGYPNPAFYQRSVRILDGQATGKLSGTQGAYKNPASLPNGKLLVSYAPNVVDLSSINGKFELVVVDSITGQRTPLLAHGSSDLIWPVAVYARQNHGVFRSRLDEANGATTIYTDDARRDKSEITVVDMQILSSLLFQNTRTGRSLPGANFPVEVWESLPPESGVTTFAQGGSFVTDDAFGQVYARRRLRGSAQPAGDSSFKIQIPGGMPMVLATSVRLAGEAKPQLHFQREEMQFYPGEWVRQSFKKELFNGLCGGCHGSVNGLESHIAVNPDLLTQASNVAARGQQATPLLSADGKIQGPPFP